MRIKHLSSDIIYVIISYHLRSCHITWYHIMSCTHDIIKISPCHKHLHLQYLFPSPLWFPTSSVMGCSSRGQAPLEMRYKFSGNWAGTSDGLIRNWLIPSMMKTYFFYLCMWDICIAYCVYYTYPYHRRIVIWQPLLLNQTNTCCLNLQKLALPGPKKSQPHGSFQKISRSLTYNEPASPHTGPTPFHSKAKHSGKCCEVAYSRRYGRMAICHLKSLLPSSNVWWHRLVQMCAFPVCVCVSFLTNKKLCNQYRLITSLLKLRQSPGHHLSTSWMSTATETLLEKAELWPQSVRNKFVRVKLPSEGLFDFVEDAADICTHTCIFWKGI